MHQTTKAINPKHSTHNRQRTPLRHSAKCTAVTRGHPYLEGPLPCHELDHLHAVDDLIHQAHALISPLHQGATQANQVRRHLGCRGQHKHDTPQGGHNQSAAAPWVTSHSTHDTTFVKSGCPVVLNTLSCSHKVLSHRRCTHTDARHGLPLT